MRISERSLPVLSSMVRHSPAGELVSAKAPAAASSAAVPTTNRTIVLRMTDLRSTFARGSLPAGLNETNRPGRLGHRRGAQDDRSRRAHALNRLPVPFDAQTRLLR